ncbi:MAG: GTP cyclohydrolase I FolE [Acidobacteriia bacterium]|nr:GTP cyclohydrolase I FolE [Terriglobia bacterium]
MSKSGLTRTDKPLQEATLEELIRELLVRVGEDPDREGLLETPQRVAKALNYLTQGYQEDSKLVLNNALYTVQYDEMVIVKDIDLFSLCEHHLLPFFGKCHVAYLPNQKVIGLSKIARLVEMFSRRLQIQERLTCQIAETLNEEINPLGVAVVIEAQHLCMIMRGVEKQNSLAMTSSMLGCFRQEQQTRLEFLELLRNSKSQRL